MHLKRLFIALILIPLLYLYVTKLPPVYFLFLLIVASALALYEFYSMYNIKGLLRYSGIALGLLIIVSAYFSRNLLAELFGLTFIILSSVRLFSKRDPVSSLKDIATASIAVVYIPGLLGYQVYLREQGAGWLVFLYGCVWAADSMAYSIGSSIGRRRLYREVSPNKTVAGAVGSVAGGAIGAIVVRALFFNQLQWGEAIVIGVLIGIISIMGDLVESMFKRDAGVKDSSSILSAHGGMLDKIDSVLFAGPLLYWLTNWMRIM